MTARIGSILYGAAFLACAVMYTLSHLFFSLAVVPLGVVLLPISRRVRIASLFFHLGIVSHVRGLWAWLRMYRIDEVSGLARALAARPAVFVANHRGRMDGLFVLAYLSDTGVVMKSSYIRNPFFAPFARHLDFVSVDANSVSELGQTMERCRAILAAGRNLLVFPEGTRAPGGRMLPFKDIAFRLAQAAGVPVVPVVVHTDVPLLGKERATLAPERPFTLRIRFLEPMRAEAGERAPEFANRAQRLMAQELKALDAGTVWETMR
jgi:1-acyl-sn-glycerol-3-phosphate acyltransferase